MRAGVALGSNLGDRSANLRNARQKIEALAGVHSLILASDIYETEPVACESGAPKFLNAVVEFEYAGQPQELLSELAVIENSLGRPADHEKNTSRPIDLDLLYFGTMEMVTRDLHLPHPRLIERRFVLAPLAEIQPNLLLPKQTEPIRALLARMPDGPAVVRLELKW